jgi:hypothetical protein
MTFPNCSKCGKPYNEHLSLLEYTPYGPLGRFQVNEKCKESLYSPTT